MELMHEFGEYVQASPSSYHAAVETARLLAAAGFAEQNEAESFDVTPGGHYFVRDGACMAWRIPATTDKAGFRIVGSHTDSPSFKLKPQPTHNCAGWQQIGCEVYGGPLASSWLNRDCGLAGRLATKNGEIKLVETGPIVVIPQLAPHLDRSDTLQLDRQQHLMPVVAAGKPDFDVLGYLCEQAGVARDDLAGFDIFVTDTQKPGAVGVDNEMWASWRIDNLSSVYASVRAIIDATDSPDIQVLAAFDHEEVGSSTTTGGAGPILEEVLRRIAASLGYDDQAYLQMLTRSWCVSADAAHAVNPNYVAKHDPDTHPQFNQGPVLKLNGNQRYATDAVGTAMWIRACEQADVPTQVFVGNNAVPCGSTIGPLTATRIGIRTVDIGIPMLSMHSARELCGVADIGYMTKALTAFYAGA